MPTVVEIPSIGNVEFPDGMTPQQINDVIETEITKTRQPADPYSGGDPELGRILGPQLDPAEAQRRNEVAQLRQIAREAPFRDVAPIPDLNLIRQQRVAEFAAAPPSLRLVSEALDTALDEALTRAAERPETATPFASIGKAFGKGAGAAVESLGAGVEASGRATLAEQPLTEDDVLAARREAAIESIKLGRARVGGRGFRPSSTVSPVSEPTEAEIQAELDRGSPAQDLAERQVRNKMAEQQDYLRLTGQINDPLERAAAKNIKIPAGEFMQEAGKSAATSELYADPYHDQTPIAQRLKERPFETVFVEGAKQAPNFIFALGSGAFGTRLGVNPYVSAGTSSFVLEKGDIFQEGKEFLIGKYGGEDKIPSKEWVKLNQLANEHGAFNAVLDAVTPGSQVARAMVGKAMVQRLLSKEGAKYIGKELIKDLAKELPTELAQEESTMRAMEQTGKTLTPEEKMDRRLSVVAGVILPVAAGSAVSSATAIQRGKPAAEQARPAPEAPAAETRPAPTGITPEAAIISPHETAQLKPKTERIPRLPPRVPRGTTPSSEAPAPAQPWSQEWLAERGMWELNGKIYERGPDGQARQILIAPPVTTAPEAPRATISPGPVSEEGQPAVAPAVAEITAKPAIVEPAAEAAMATIPVEPISEVGRAPVPPARTEAEAAPKFDLDQKLGVDLAARVRATPRDDAGLEIAAVTVGDPVDVKIGNRMVQGVVTTKKDTGSAVSPFRVSVRLPQGSVVADVGADRVKPMDALIQARQAEDARLFPRAATPEPSEAEIVSEAAPEAVAQRQAGDLKQGPAVTLTPNTVAGEGPYRVTQWLDGQPVRHEAFDTVEAASRGFDRVIAENNRTAESLDEPKITETARAAPTEPVRQPTEERTETAPEAEPRLTESQALTEADIAQARAEVEARGLPEVPAEAPKTGTLHGGVPVDIIADSVKRATQKLGDKLGVPVGSTEIIAPEAAQRPGPLSQIVSPNRIAKKYPIFKPVFDRAQVAAETQERLRKVFRDRLQHVDEILGWSATANVPGSPAARRFARNYALFQEIRLTQDALGKDFTPAELQDMFGASPEIIRALRLTRSAYDHALDLANRVRELRGKPGITRREGYVPHFFHEWMIDVDGQLTYSARSLREAIAMTNDLARAGHQIRIRPKTRSFPGEATHAAVLGDRQYFNIQSRLKNNLGIDRADAEALMAELAKRRGRSRFVGNFLRRRGYDGWEQDLRWADRHYFNMVSRFAALDPFKSWSVSYFENKVGGFDKEHRGIEKYMKDFINDVNGNPTHIEDLLNSWIARTPAVGQFLGKYLGDRPALQIAGGITNAVAIAKLGLYNVSSAVVNLTQLMNTNALVGSRSMAVGIARTAAIDAKLAGRALGIQAAERADRDMGILKQAGVDVQLGLESGAGYSRAAQMGRLFRASTAFFQGVEHNLRRIAVLAGYDKARREGKTHREAIEAAKDINNRSNFEYGITDAPGFLRRGGPVSQVLFQFKKFPIKQMEFMTSLQGMQHARFWIPFLLMAGYFGFPGVEFLNNAVRQLFDLDLELELKQALLAWAGKDEQRLAIAKTIMYGAFSHDQLGGVDLTHRVGGGDFIPSDLSDLWGPFVSSTVRATQLAARDEWADALRAISTAPGNVIIALRNDGEISNPWQRGRVGVRLTPGQQAAKAAGFTPTAESVQRDIYRIAGYETQRFNRQRQELVDDLIRAARLGEMARESGNTAGERRAEEQIDKIAARAERLQIPLSSDIIRREARLKQLTPAQRAWLGASDIIRARLAPVYEALETELEEPNAAGAVP